MSDVETSLLYDTELEISRTVEWDAQYVHNVIKLLNDDATIPFIARYTVYIIVDIY
jgi:transcriptional accessory protein Tex/SPT6